MPSSTDATVQNRSEIVFMFDAVDCNPNGNPMSGSNRPRIDAQTQQAVVTDVRLKRYLRDQLAADGHGVFVANVKNDEGHAPTREALLEACIKDVDEVEEDMFESFKANAADVRYFGATLSIDADDDSLAEAVLDVAPAHLTGAVQFAPARSLNAVVENEEYNSLTSVIGTKEGKEQGGFDLDDHRIKYGLFRFHGVVNENAADDTSLTDTDVKRLDTLCWRAIKNQARSRSKTGQEPRLYLRVEYDEKSYHMGDLETAIDIDTDRSAPEPEMRSIRDVTVAFDELVDTISTNTDRIDTVHIAANDALSVSYDGDEGGPDLLLNALAKAVGEDAVHNIDVYDEYEKTLPDVE